ncbi:MAG: DUF6431 domain-containing protein [Acidimicrobiales bacterium]
MVGTDADEVERDLVGGNLACPECEGELRPWGFARWRTLRDRGTERRVRPRRSRCRRCRKTHVLLPIVALLRRRDLAAVIGEALRRRHLEGVSRREVAEFAGVHPDTARGWLRRFAARAEAIRVHFTALVHRLDPEIPPIEPRGSPAADALEAIGVAAAAATRRLGPAPLWDFVAAASGGLLLANASVLLPPAR